MGFLSLPQYFSYLTFCYSSLLTEFCVLLSIYCLARMKAADYENQGSVILSHVWCSQYHMWPWDICPERALVESAQSQGFPGVGSTCERMHLKTKWVNTLMEKTVWDKHFPRANEPLSNVAGMHLVDVLLLVFTKSSELMNWTFVFSVTITSLRYGLSCWHVQTPIYYWKMCLSLSLIGSHHAFQR